MSPQSIKVKVKRTGLREVTCSHTSILYTTVGAIVKRGLNQLRRWESTGGALHRRRRRRGAAPAPIPPKHALRISYNGINFNRAGSVLVSIRGTGVKSSDILADQVTRLIIKNMAKAITGATTDDDDDEIPGSDPPEDVDFNILNEAPHLITIMRNSRAFPAFLTLNSLSIEFLRERVGAVSKYSFFYDAIDFLALSKPQYYEFLIQQALRFELDFVTFSSKSSCVFKAGSILSKLLVPDMSLSIKKRASQGFINADAYKRYTKSKRGKKYIENTTSKMREKYQKYIGDSSESMYLDGMTVVASLEFFTWLVQESNFLFNFKRLLFVNIPPIYDKLSTGIFKRVLFVRNRKVDLAKKDGRRVTDPPEFQKLHKLVAVIVYGNHIGLLIPKGSSFMRRPFYKGITNYKEHELIEPFEIKDENRKILTYDIETFQTGGPTGTVTPYSVQWAWGPEYEDSEAIISPTCFLEFLFRLGKYTLNDEKEGNERIKQYIMYAHNGAKFDAQPLITILANLDRPIKLGGYEDENTQIGIEFDISRCIVKNGRILKLEIDYVYGKDRKKYATVRFADTLQYALASLKNLAKGYNLPLQKASFVHEDITSWEIIEELRDDIEHYGRLDAVILFQLVGLLKTAFEDIVPESDNKYPITNFVTSSGFARAIFFHEFNKEPIYRLSLELNEVFGKEYTGGIVQTGIQGHFNPALESKLLDGKIGVIHGDDFNSLYPTIMFHSYFPIGKPKDIEVGTLNTFESKWSFKQLAGLEKDQREDILENQLGEFFFIYIKAFHISGTSAIPFFWTRTKKYGLHRPYLPKRHPIVRMVSKPQLEFILDNGCLGMEIKIECKKGGFKFKRGNPFKEYIDFFSKAKIRATELRESEPENAARHNAFRNACKLALNSLYGSFAIKPTGSMLSQIQDSSEDRILMEALHSFLIVKEHNLDSKIQKLIDIKTRITPPYANKSIAKAITDMTQVEFYKAKMHIKRVGGFFLYGDTDSFYAWYPSEEIHQDFLNTYQRWWKRGELGSLEPEHPGYDIKEMAVIAPKVYGLRKENIEDGKSVDVLKFKGVTTRATYLWKEIRQLDDDTKIQWLSEPRSDDWFEKYPDAPQETLSFSDFEDFSKGEYSEIMVSSFQIRGGLQAIGVYDSFKRTHITKRYKRTINKGVLTDCGSKNFSVVTPRIYDGEEEE